MSLFFTVLQVGFQLLVDMEQKLAAVKVRGLSKLGPKASKVGAA